MRLKYGLDEQVEQAIREKQSRILVKGKVKHVKKVWREDIFLGRSREDGVQTKQSSEILVLIKLSEEAAEATADYYKDFVMERAGNSRLTVKVKDSPLCARCGSRDHFSASCPWYKTQLRLDTVPHWVRDAAKAYRTALPEESEEEEEL